MSVLVANQAAKVSQPMLLTRMGRWGGVENLHGYHAAKRVIAQALHAPSLFYQGVHGLHVLLPKAHPTIDAEISAGPQRAFMQAWRVRHHAMMDGQNEYCQEDVVNVHGFGAALIEVNLLLQRPQRHDLCAKADCPHFVCWK